MKTVRRQRWRPLILLLIFFLTLCLWFKENLESFVEKELEQLLKIDVKIASVKGGILSNLVLINLKLLPQHPPFNFPAFEAERVEFNFRLWALLFGEVTLKDALPLTITRAKLSTVRPILTGVSLQTDPKSNRGDRSAQVSDFWWGGNFYLFGDTKMEFAGDISISKDGLKIDGLSIVRVTEKELTPLEDESLTRVAPRQKKERIDVEGKIDASSFLAKVNLEHLQIKDFYLSTDIEIENKIAKGFVKGKLITSNSIIDFRPVKEIKANYELCASTFRLIALEWGEEVRLSGIMELTQPTYVRKGTYVDLLLELSALNLEELVFLSGVKEKEKISGLVSGEFIIKGFLPFPDIKGSLVGIDGNFGDLDYDQLKVNLEGKGPLVQIVDSWIRKGKSYTTLEGELDLAKIGSTELFEDLEIIFDEKAMVWRGWDITRDAGPKLELGKDIGDDFRVRFKTFMNDELLNEYVKGDELGLDYKISEDETLKMRLKENEEFLGIEHKLKF